MDISLALFSIIATHICLDCGMEKENECDRLVWMKRQKSLSTIEQLNMFDFFVFFVGVNLFQISNMNRPTELMNVKESLFLPSITH